MLPCPSLSPWVSSNSCPLSQWCQPTISSSIAPFSCLQSSAESGSFLMSQLFTSGGQSIGASPSAPVLPMNIQDWFPLGLTGLISSLSKGFSRVFSSTTVWKNQFLGAQPSLSIFTPKLFLLYWGHNEKPNPPGKKPHEEKILHLLFILWGRAGENQVTSCICLPLLIFLFATLHRPPHMYLHYTRIDKGTINFIL